MNRKNKILSIYVIAGAISLVIGLILLGPIFIWKTMPDIPLNVWIIDKTVPKEDYREHKGLMWILNHEKIVDEKTGKPLKYDEDYFGFFPKNKKSYDTKELPETKEDPDLIYITDTYGVYKDDYGKLNEEAKSSNLLYGGLEKEELSKIVNNMGDGRTLIGEFNIASSPTDVERRKELEVLFGVNWSGWKGRYFKNLERDFEIPAWMAENYEKQEKKDWNFSGSGYILISEDDKIVVLEDGKDVSEKGLTIAFEDQYKEEFDIDKDIAYQYWFEFIEPSSNSEQIASYHLDVTDQGEKTLKELGLSSVFPAVVRTTHSKYISYYFSGDYADVEKVDKIWSYYGLQQIKKITSLANKESSDYFYWNAYVPMMKKIVSDLGGQKKQNSIAKDEKMPYISRVEGKEFQIYENGKWEKKFLKGVNLGAAKPGSFPGDLDITRSEYLRWFKYISEMNAEVIRVYTTLKPDFYDAFLLYNKTAEKPLYLIQGVWVKEEDVEELKDAYKDDQRILNSFIKDGSDLVDVLHGDATLPKKKGFADGTYTSDVSEYVIGWILGIEWDGEFVDITNKNNPDKVTYDGKHMYTENAAPFESFLCHVADEIIDYELDKYGTERPVSFSNWPTTDMLSHPNEPYEKEDFATVNVENIKVRENFKPGMFASYHIYPYYPEFMNYQKEYVTFKDDDGKVNTYKAYLRDLMNQHTIPVLVAEFGVPASRGNAHVNVHMGYDQGHHDEKEQGLIINNLLQDIYDEGYCGGLVFAWQDEWFKRTWNTMDFDLAQRRPFWSNPQTNEQEFGLLAFEPGEKSMCLVDGDIGDWKDDKPIYSKKDVKLYVKSDEKYVYIMADTKNFDFDKDKLVIPVDTIDGQGNTTDTINNIKFSRPADFSITIDGRENSKMMIDSYYDSFQSMYGTRLKMIDVSPSHTKKDSGVFEPIYLCLSKEVTLPEDKTILPFLKYDTGVLKYGNANPNHKDYNSLSDIFEKDGKIEMRIPWQMLNVMDPSTKSVMADVNRTKHFYPRIVDGFHFGAGIIKEGHDNETIDMYPYSWDIWEKPTFHERLKPSYYMVKDAFKRIK